MVPVAPLRLGGLACAPFPSARMGISGRVACSLYVGFEGIRRERAREQTTKNDDGGDGAHRAGRVRGKTASPLALSSRPCAGPGVRHVFVLCIHTA